MRVCAEEELFSALRNVATITAISPCTAMPGDSYSLNEAKLLSCYGDRRQNNEVPMLLRTSVKYGQACQWPVLRAMWEIKALTQLAQVGINMLVRNLSNRKRKVHKPGDYEVPWVMVAAASAPRRRRPADLCEFEASLVYITNSRRTMAT